MKKNGMLIILGWLVVSGTLHAQDWLRWRGEGGQNHASSLPQPLQGTVAVTWEAQVGKGHASVVIHENKVYTLGNTLAIKGRDTTEQDVVVCLNAATGAPLWKHVYDCPAGSWAGPRATPLWDQDRLYTLSRAGHLFCLDANTGKPIWQKQLVDEGLSRAPEWGFSGSPVTEGGTLYLNAGLSGLALDKRTGDVIWKSAKKEAGHGTPVLFTHEGQRQLALMGRGMLYVMDAASGRVLWTRIKSEDCYTDPLIIGNDMLLATYRGGSERLRLTDGEPQVIWANPQTRTGNWQTLTLHQQHGYAPRSLGETQLFQCIHIESGQIRWAENLGDWGAMTLAGDQLVIVTGNGELIIAPATPEGFKPILRKRFVQLPPFSRGMDHVVWTHPVWINGRLYVRTTHGRLFCLKLN